MYKPGTVSCSRRPRTRPGRCKRRGFRRGIRRSRALLNPPRRFLCRSRPWRTDKGWCSWRPCNRPRTSTPCPPAGTPACPAATWRPKTPSANSSRTRRRSRRTRRRTVSPSTLFRTYTRRCPRRIYRYRCTPRRTRPRRTCPRTRTSFPPSRGPKTPAFRGIRTGESRTRRLRNPDRTRKSPDLPCPTRPPRPCTPPRCTPRASAAARPGSGPRRGRFR